MTLAGTPRPLWLTFDCYGTLIQWDEGPVAAVRQILARQGRDNLDPRALLDIYDPIEHALEREAPHRSFRSVSTAALRRSMAQLRLTCSAEDVAILIDGIGRMPPFPEAVATLQRLKAAGFRLCIVSNSDDDVIAGNVAQLAGAVDRVVTAEQAAAYKPDRRIFEHAWRSLGVTRDEVCHICASPRLDHAAARDLDFRCIWVDRGTGRQLLPDYRPDAIVPTLDRIPGLFEAWGWMDVA